MTYSIATRRLAVFGRQAVVALLRHFCREPEPLDATFGVLGSDRIGTLFEVEFEKS